MSDPTDRKEQPPIIYIDHEDAELRATLSYPGEVSNLTLRDAIVACLKLDEETRNKAVIKVEGGAVFHGWEVRKIQYRQSR